MERPRDADRQRIGPRRPRPARHQRRRRPVGLDIARERLEQPGHERRPILLAIPPLLHEVLDDRSAPEHGGTLHRWRPPGQCYRGLLTAGIAGQRPLPSRPTRLAITVTSSPASTGLGTWAWKPAWRARVRSTARV